VRDAAAGLQCVAGSCIELQCVAVSCIELQSAVVCYREAKTHRIP